ncbi:leucine-rich repeat-containing protein 40-like [Cylas formicarius]|uniref:leucine-rich repeat-containing protein 40-like n=1 Tax=Cylas formicarius TaxID=197179 RepID=UPI002958DA9D|nr:leucine-rich repeat-containing protein 40-like [Cylas formicarius]
MDLGIENYTGDEVIVTHFGKNFCIKIPRKKDGINNNEILQKFNMPNLLGLFRKDMLDDLKCNLDQIVALDFSECGLHDLPQQLCTPNLKHLNLAHNKLKEMPLCLYSGKMNKIEYLDLSNNFLTSCDEEPDCVLQLKKINLSSNCLENLPAWFLEFRCTNLEELDYSENKAKHFSFLKNSTNLTLMKISKLKLKNSCLIDTDFALLKKFRYLEYLDISNTSNCISDNYINNFKEIQQLFQNNLWERMKILNLAFLNISFFPEDIFRLENLRELHLNNNNISWLTDGLKLLINLQILDISNNGLLVLSNEIVHLNNLKILKASHNYLEELLGLPPYLETLDLYNNCLENLNHINIDSLNSIDLELNYIELINCSEYEYKRDYYRNSNCCQDREQGAKIRTSVSSHSVWSSCDLESETSELSNTNLQYLNVVEENWDDEEVENVVQFSDITPSDDEWDGDDKIKQNCCIKKSFVQKNEDWIFVDAD